MNRRYALLVLAPIAALALAAGRPDNSAAVKQNASNFQAAWNKHNSKALAAFWAKDGDLIDPHGEASSGADGVEKYFAREMTGAGALAKSTFNLTKDSVRFITPDVALEDWEVTITGIMPPDGSTPGPMAHRVVIVSKKEGGAWKFAAARPGIFAEPGKQGHEMPNHDEHKPHDAKPSK